MLRAMLAVSSHLHNSPRRPGRNLPKGLQLSLEPVRAGCELIGKSSTLATPLTGIGQFEYLVQGFSRCLLPSVFPASLQSSLLPSPPESPYASYRWRQCSPVLLTALPWKQDCSPPPICPLHTASTSVPVSSLHTHRRPSLLNLGVPIDGQEAS